MSIIIYILWVDLIDSSEYFYIYYG